MLERRRARTLGIGKVDSSGGFSGGRRRDGRSSDNSKSRRVGGDLKGGRAGVSARRYDRGVFSLIRSSSEQRASLNKELRTFGLGFGLALGMGALGTFEHA